MAAFLESVDGNHRRGEILPWSSELSFMRDINFTCLQFYRLCNKDRDDRSACTSGLTTQHKILSQWCRFLLCPHLGTLLLGSMSSLEFHLWLCTHNPCDGRVDGAHHLLARRLLSMCNQSVSGEVTWLRGVKRAALRCTSVQCKMKWYINAKWCVCH